MGRRAVWLLPLLLGCGDEVGLVVPGLASALRPDNDNSFDQFRFDDADIVVSHDSPGGAFRVHYTTAGVNAVPAADLDQSGVPDFVEETATTYDEVLAFYESLGYRAPLPDDDVVDNGGDGRFDVYLIDFAGNADGAFRTDGYLSTNPDRGVGYMVQENDFAGYGYPSLTVAIRTLSSHEFFHGVQAAYDAFQGSIASEGTAVWASEAFDPSLEDLEWFAAGYLDNVERSLDKPLPGPVDPFSYGSAIFWQFLAERFDDGFVLSLWEALENGAGTDPDWWDTLDAELAARGSSFAESFTEFATWNLYTGNRASGAYGYAAAADYPRPKLNLATPPYQDGELRLFYAATQYYSLFPGGRDQMAAALVGDSAGVELAFVVERGGAYEPAVIASGASGTVSTAGATRLLVALVNTARSGDSKKPGLCIGSPAEVAACKESLDPSPKDSDAKEDSGCAATRSAPLAWLVLALLFRRVRTSR